jgi:hypothetical protein
VKKLNLVLLLLGGAFLVYLVWSTGVAELWRQLSMLGWGLLPFLLCEGASEMLHTLGWRHCLSGPYRSLSSSLLFRIRLAGYAINYLTPTASLGGELTKAALLSSNHRGPGAVSGVLIEKVCLGLAHVLFVAFGSLFVMWSVRLPRPLWMAMGLSAALVASGVVTFLFLQRRGKIGGLIRWLAARKTGNHALKKAAASITGVDEAMREFYHERPLDMWLAVGWHLLGHLPGIIQTWCFFYWLGQGTSLRVAAGVCFLGAWFDLLAFAVPLNAGSLEGGRIVAVKAFGYTTLLGMTYGVAIRLTQIFWAGIGLVIYGVDMARTSHPLFGESPAQGELPPPEDAAGELMDDVLTPTAPMKEQVK